MAKKGTFTEAEPAELVDFLESKLLKKGFAGKLFSRYDGVYVTARGGEKGGAAVRIGKPGLLSRDVGVLVSPPSNADRGDVARHLEAAGVHGPEVRKSFGQTIYDFDPATPAPELVTFALAALRALGSTPADGRWQWEASQPAGE